MTTYAASVSPAGSWVHPFRVCFLLVWNDCKQGLRKHLAGTSTRDRVLRGGGAIAGLAFLAGLHFGALDLVTYVWNSPSKDEPALMAGLSTAIWSFLLFVMMSGGLVRALVVLHEQDDSNLLLSSPVPPRAILAGRLFGNALQSCLVDGFIIVPYINIQVVTLGVHPNFLWGYPVWFALAVIVTCIDGLFSFGLIHWLGLRRARVFSQAIPFLLIFGVTFFAGTISVSVAQLSGDAAHMPAEMQAHFIALSHSPLAWLAYAASGHPPYLLGVFSTAAVLAIVTLALTEKAFIEGTQNVGEINASARPGTADGPFHAGMMKLEIWKNMRMVVRTPMMLVQCLAQSLMPIGIACVLGRDDFGRAVAFFVVFAVGILSGMFTIAAGTVEECEDLLHMAPVSPRVFRLAKMASGFVLPVGVAILTGIGLMVAGEELLGWGVLLGGIPLGLASSLCGETFATAVKPGVRPKLLADPIMMIPLLGMQITSGIVAGGVVFSTLFTWPFLLLALLASYVIMVGAVGLAQIRKPLFG